ncbi:MAG: thioredoxin family protein [Ignavibacteriales bacterium]
MNSKLRVGILVLVALVVVGVLGYKFVVPASDSSVKDKPHIVAEQSKDNGVNNNKESANVQNDIQKEAEKEGQQPTATPKDQSVAEAKSVPESKELNKESIKKSEPVKAKDEISKKPVWILFRSTTCIPCVQMQETMDSLKPEFKDKIEFVEVDVNDPANESKIKEYNIRYIPTTFLYDKHEGLFFQQVGAMSVEDMQAKLNALLEVK